VAPFVAGKNRIINGDFYWNQRNFVSETPAGSSNIYVVDRIFFTCDAFTTASVQQFPAGTVLGGQNPKQFGRAISSGQTLSTAATIIRQTIEEVTTFAGQTVTLSFWAKCASGTPKIAVEIDQQFGGGGSARVRTFINQVTLSTNWERKSLTFTVPSISGKTIASGSFFALLLWASAGSASDANTGSLGIQSNTFDIWGLQLEAGNVATPFQTASGSIAGELELCKRYYENSYPEGYAPGADLTGSPFGTLGAFLYGIQAYCPAGGVAGSNRSRNLIIINQKRTTPTVRVWDSVGNLSRYCAADANGGFISNNNAFDAFGGAGPANKIINFQTVAASATHIYLGVMWEASAEI
jgi:hypothetical protein